MKIFNKLKIFFLQKAYVEGIYADTPQNRKLGRVGMSYAQYAEKTNQKEEKKDKVLKERQLEIVKKFNPADESLGNHTWIKDIDDIKTFDELLGKNEEDEFVYPDFTPKDAYLASAKGKVIIYSSKPIKEGVFVSPSKICAKDYAGEGKIYSKEVKLKDVAWIDGGQGQYTPINN